MNYSNKYFDELNNDKGFIKSNLEKVVRLLDVLNFIATKLDPDGQKLILKGGTAINLMYTNLARLSVDIDLDYVGSLDKDITNQDRSMIMDDLDNYMKGEEYVISSKSRGSAILESRTYLYTNAYGNRDNIKVEINFIDRIHVGPSVRKIVKYFDKEVPIQTLCEEELFAMKNCALIDRSKPRDLFDVDKLKSHLSNLVSNLLRKMTIFYISLDGIFEINGSTYDKVQLISQKDIKKELLPVLSKNNKFDLTKTKDSAITFLKELLTLTNDERKYLLEFANGRYYPELLFANTYSERVLKHPMAKWILAKMKK